MPNLSIIIGYRNRDLLRVERCLCSLSKQSYENFDVIFVDYGSDINYAKEVKLIVESFHFATYYYSNSIGYPWNRSQALNTGVRLSSAEYILFADIDLIFSVGSIAALMAKASEMIAVYSSMFFLKQSFKNWNNLFDQPLTALKDSGDEPVGAIFLINRSVFERIGGFDEYYCFWGVEDRDLYYRLNQINVKRVSIDKYKYPIFHQWHSIVSDRKKDFFPEKWWDEINIHYSINKHSITRNNGHWGKIIKEEDRPVQHAKKIISLTFNKYGRSYDKSQAIDSILDAVNSLQKNDYLEIILEKRKTAQLVFYIIKYFNLAARKFHIPIGLDYIENVEREKYFYPYKDIFYLVWYLSQRKDVIKDYEIKDDDSKMVIKLM